MGRGKSPSQSLRNKAMIQEAMAGKSNEEIAAKYGLTDAHTSQILNHSEETKDIHKLVDDGFKKMVDSALKTIKRIVEQEDDNTNALKAALAVMERSVGKVPDKVEAKNLNINTNLSEEELIRKVETKLAEVKKRTLK